MEKVGHTVEVFLKRPCDRLFVLQYIPLGDTAIQKFTKYRQGDGSVCGGCTVAVYTSVYKPTLRHSEFILESPDCDLIRRITG